MGNNINTFKWSHTFLVSCTKFYTKFRIKQTGKNDDNHWRLLCSGFEIYGLIVLNKLNLLPKLKIKIPELSNELKSVSTHYLNEPGILWSCGSNSQGQQGNETTTTVTNYKTLYTINLVKKSVKHPFFTSKILK